VGGFVVSEDQITEQPEETRWFIDVDWLEAHNRSFVTMARACLCNDSRKKLATKGKASSVSDILDTIRSCCSQIDGFISSELPVMESTFRLFLSSNNEPLDIIELGRRLSELRGIDTYRTSVEVLSRLLKHDEFYGLRPVDA
jgi:hypothetical protein